MATEETHAFEGWDFVFIRYNRRFMKLLLADILYLESRKNYTRIVTTGGVMMVLARTRYFEEMLPVAGFRRIHRSFIVRLDRVESFDSRTATVAGEKLPVGPQYLDHLIGAAPVIATPPDGGITHFNGTNNTASATTALSEEALEI